MVTTLLKGVRLSFPLGLKQKLYPKIPLEGGSIQLSIFSFFVLNRSIRRRRQWQPTPVLLPGKSHGRRSQVGCSPWGCKESDTIERLHFHFSLPCIGEGNGNPLQGSCLENPKDGGAWWAAIYGVAQCRTRLKRLSSSSSRTSMKGSLAWSVWHYNRIRDIC